MKSSEKVSRGRHKIKAADENRRVSKQRKLAEEVSRGSRQRNSVKEVRRFEQIMIILRTFLDFFSVYFKETLKSKES